MASEYEPYTECVDCGATYDLDEETGYCCNEYECSLRQTKERSFRNGCIVGAAIVAWGCAIKGIEQAQRRECRICKVALAWPYTLCVTCADEQGP